MTLGLIRLKRNSKIINFLKENYPKALANDRQVKHYVESKKRVSN